MFWILHNGTVVFLGAVAVFVTLGVGFYSIDEDTLAAISFGLVALCAILGLLCIPFTNAESIQYQSVYGARKLEFVEEDQDSKDRIMFVLDGKPGYLMHSEVEIIVVDEEMYGDQAENFFPRELPYYEGVVTESYKYVELWGNTYFSSDPEVKHGYRIYVPKDFLEHNYTELDFERLFGIMGRLFPLRRGFFMI